MSLIDKDERLFDSEEIKIEKKYKLWRFIGNSIIKKKDFS